MIKIEKEDSAKQKIRISTIGYSRHNGTSIPAEGRGKSFLVAKANYMKRDEELHWMAYAAYNQSK